MTAAMFVIYCAQLAADGGNVRVVTEATPAVRQTTPLVFLHYVTSLAFNRMEHRFFLIMVRKTLHMFVNKQI